MFISLIQFNVYPTLFYNQNICIFSGNTIPVVLHPQVTGCLCLSSVNGHFSVLTHSWAKWCARDVKKYQLIQIIVNAPDSSVYCALCLLYPSYFYDSFLRLPFHSIIHLSILYCSLFIMFSQGFPSSPSFS